MAQLSELPARLSHGSEAHDEDLTQTLISSFSALADEVQSLIDRKTILEHKLRYAHEQYQYLADKYAPAEPEIARKLAKLQLPPELNSPVSASFVPLPRRGQTGTSQHQIAVLIREGRMAARQLATVANGPSRSGSSKETVTEQDTMTSQTPGLEQDFTVEGKRKGRLECPFSPPKAEADQDLDGHPAESQDAADPTPHHSTDPICAAMYEETTSQPAPANGATKCPIRFLDQHSPEEIANYVEKHKHEIPRSHEVCVRRYQKNEDQIKKLDAKYGNLVSMINDLSHLHQPLLPAGQQQASDDIDNASNQRVENWAHEVSASADHEDHDRTAMEEELVKGDEVDRESHFDRPFKEIRVGESPSRPWGYSVPVYDLGDHQGGRPASPPPAPVRMPSPSPAASQGPKKCPFDHTKLASMMGAAAASSPVKREEDEHSLLHEGEAHVHHETPFTPTKEDGPHDTPFTPTKHAVPSTARPTFITPEMPKLAPPRDGAPQMVFTGPVFIGYPFEQAVEMMKQLQKQ